MIYSLFNPGKKVWCVYYIVGNQTCGYSPLSGKVKIIEITRNSIVYTISTSKYDIHVSDNDVFRTKKEAISACDYIRKKM